MLNILIGAAIITIIAGAGGYVIYTRYNDAASAQQKQIVELQRQVADLQQKNAQLDSDLAKSQREEERLSTANQDLSKALATARLTGKIPELPESSLPYPPK
jgi:septal ring factor EnvC (AmiA/AmiB activator)